MRLLKRGGWWMRLSGGKVIVGIQGRRGITNYYDLPVWDEGGRTLSVAKEEAKREVGANSEEVI